MEITKEDVQAIRNLTFNLRGNVVPVVGLGLKLGMGDKRAHQ